MAAGTVDPGQGGEPPAVVSLLARQLDSTGYAATLLDLAARGWFELAEAEPGQLMCLLPPAPPQQSLAPYEERAALHLARRAAGRGQVPVSALAEGFAEGQAAFAEAFHDEVLADARQRGLIKRGLRGRIGCLLALAGAVPAGVLAAAVHVSAHPGRAIAPVAGWLVFVWLIGVAVKGSERPTAAGRACLAGWRHQAGSLAGGDPRAALPGADPGTVADPRAEDDLALALRVAGGDRTVAQTAALGAAPTAVAVFTRSKSLVWSSYGGRWRQISIGDPAARAMPGGTGLVLLAALGVPAFSALLVAGTQVAHGFEGAVLVLGALAIPVAGVLLAMRSRRADVQLPRFAEFDGVAVERWTWVEKGDDGGDVTCYGVALDDGQRSRAWTFTVDPGEYTRLVPGTLVHATVNPRRNRLRTITVTGSPQVPPQVAAAQVARLPLCARMVTAEEAGRVLGVIEKDLQRYLLGVSCIWKPAKGGGSVTVTAGRRALIARHAERTGRRLPGGDGVDAWLVGNRSVVLRRGEQVVKVILSGDAGRDGGEALAWLASRIAERLVTPPGDAALSEDEWAAAPEG